MWRQEQIAVRGLHFEYGRQQIRKATTISRPHLENERGRYPLVFDNRGVRAHGEKVEHRLAWISYPPPSLLHIPVGSDLHPLMRDQHYGASSWKETESKSNGFEGSLSGPWVYLLPDSFIHPCWCRFFSALQIHLSLSCPWASCDQLLATVCQH